MINRYTIEVIVQAKYSGTYVYSYPRSFKNVEVSIKHAEKINHHNMHYTQYQRMKMIVSVVDMKTKTIMWEHEGYLEPSVGELGYW